MRNAILPVCGDAMIILQDTREKSPWNFTKYGMNQEITTLKTGDYSIKGYEDFFTCERKSSTGEISTNFGKKWKVFTKELKRMQVIPHRYIICEFPLSHIYSFPTFSSIPNSQWKGLKITSAFLAKRIEEICGEFDINVIFSEDRLDAERKFIEIVHAITD